MRSKLSLMTLAGSILMSSCSTFLEESTDPQQVKSSEVQVATESSSNPNARKSTEVAYYERFTNQLALVDEAGNQVVDENGKAALILPNYLPGTGIGNSSHMGKAYTFINQYASYGPTGLGTVGAPVTQFFGKKLSDMGVLITNSEVSSVTTDGKGNSIWFKNIQNNVTQVSPERSDFVAEVEIIGGTGKFIGATGSATVDGYFNPTNGQGMSTIKGKIVY